MSRLLMAAVLTILPGLAGASETLRCKVNFTCSGGACQQVSSRTFEGVIGMTGIVIEFDGVRDSLVALDRTSMGDRVFGGQLSDKLYGVFILKTDGRAKLLVEGVNGWTEERQQLMNCSTAKT